MMPGLISCTFTCQPVSFPVDAYLDVFFVSRQYVIGHRFDAFGTIHLEGFFSSQNPGREDQVRIAKCVIRVQVSLECSFEIGDCQAGHSFADGGGSTPNNARAAVNNGWRIVHHNGY
jgi:hypothetical protein